MQIAYWTGRLADRLCSPAAATQKIDVASPILLTDLESRLAGHDVSSQVSFVTNKYKEKVRLWILVERNPLINAR